MKTITLDGIEYELVPIRKEVPITKETVISIKPSVDGIEDAQPKVSDYRERYKRRELDPSDVRVDPSDVRVPKPQESNEFDSLSSQAGYDAFYGEGIERIL